MPHHLRSSLPISVKINQESNSNSLKQPNSSFSVLISHNIWLIQGTSLSSVHIFHDKITVFCHTVLVVMLHIHQVEEWKNRNILIDGPCKNWFEFRKNFVEHTDLVKQFKKCFSCCRKTCLDRVSLVKWQGESVSSKDWYRGSLASRVYVKLLCGWKQF